MLFAAYDLLILDLDGVVYVGDKPVPHAVEVLNRLSTEISICAATNNAARTPAVVSNHLADLGLDIPAELVFTSAQAAARLLSTFVPVGSSVLAVGGPGVTAALESMGYVVHRATSNQQINQQILNSVVAVVQGHGPDNSWWDYQLALAAVSKGALWVATNHDATVPTPLGIGPGNGSFVNMISTLSGRKPLFAGKPEPALFQEALIQTGAERPLVIGDRYDTDIDGAARLGLDSLLVLTGVHTSKDMGLNPSTFIGPDLRVLLED